MTDVLTVGREHVRVLAPRRAQVASSTTPGHWYDIDLDAERACQCKGYAARKDCRHVKLVRQWDGRWPAAQNPGGAQQLELETNDERGAEVQFGLLKTTGGYTMGEVASALQKEIRRGNEREAIFWATELDLTGYGNYAWKRLRVICSEDVGLAWPEGPAVIEALRTAWVEFQKDEKKNGQSGPGNSILFLVHATALLARAPKSRIIDNAANVMYAGDRAAMGVQVPDYAVDGHTARGRSMGRSERNHYDESYGLVGQALDDPYEGEARMLDGAPPRTKAA